MKNALFLALIAILTGLAFSNPVSAQTSDSDTAWIEEGKQVFLAQTQLQAYRNELDKYGPGQPMGLDNMLGDKSGSDNGFLTVLEQSFKLGVLNTFNFGRILFTNEAQGYFQEWGDQCEELDTMIAALRAVYDIMDQREVRLAEAFHMIETEQRYQAERSWTEALAQSPWAKQVLSGAELPKRPVVPADFGLNFKTDFVDENWKTFLSEQLNVANVYTFWRGGAIISALGKTKLGVGIAQTLRLTKVIDAVRAFPSAVQKPALWMIYETADGCTIKYFYTAYLGLRQLGQEKTTRITGTVGK